MTAEEKARLIALLRDTRADTRSAIQGLDPDLVIYRDSGWRVCDIAGHLTAWDAEAVATLRAYRQGKELTAPAQDIEAFNQKSYEQRRHLPAQSIYDEWGTTHEDFVAAIDEMPLDKFGDSFLFPWGNSGTITRMVEGLSRHEGRHRLDIQKALQE